MKNKKIIIICIFILLIVLGIFIWSYFNRDEEVINKTDEIVPQQEISDEQLRNTIVSLYYINKDTGNIEVESKLIDAKLLMNNAYEQIINLWLEGPYSDNLKNNCSENLKINNIKLEGDCAVINFPKKFIEEYSGTEEEKIKLIYCVVNTLTELTEINSIKILIDGQDNQYLGSFNLSERYFRINE